MNNEIRQLLEKQAAWQRTRATKTWKQKLQESSAMRKSFKALKK